MRRSLSMLLVVLLAIAALLVWRFWPTSSPHEDDPLLFGLPHVASIEGNTKGEPERVVVHLLDRHLLPREVFERDAHGQGGAERE